ncbi:hypothetical protein AAF712_013374 [Marasmius tenuissimus]|uniref:Uncharacterized protein n=1 Tax=Marasmius tenuissimus TaxID=585030 RepID=A0ABR2ZDT6_9AGAR
MQLLNTLLLALSIATTSVRAQDDLDSTYGGVDNTTLWVNAIVGESGASTVECWGIQPPFVVSTQVAQIELSSSREETELILLQPGTVGNKILQLGQLANASYTQFPPGVITDSGLHNAPNAQYGSSSFLNLYPKTSINSHRWVVLLAGQGNINFPDSPSTPNLTVNAGEILIAVDTPGTSDVGHRSVWNGGTIALQLPFEPGFVPAHKTVKGACPKQDA